MINCRFITSATTTSTTAAWGQFVLCAPTAAITVTLSTGVGHEGGMLGVTNDSASTNVITIPPNSGHTINGSTNAQTLTSARSSMVFMSNGSNLIIVSKVT